MRVCFTSDFHGRMALYEQLASLLRAERPELLIPRRRHERGSHDRRPRSARRVAFIRNDLAGMIDAWKAAVPGLTVFSILGNHDLACAEAALRDQHEAGRLILLDHRRACDHGGLRWLGFSPHAAEPVLGQGLSSVSIGVMTRSPRSTDPIGTRRRGYAAR